MSVASPVRFVCMQGWFHQTSGSVAQVAHKAYRNTSMFISKVLTGYLIVETVNQPPIPFGGQPAKCLPQIELF